jgi:hypothetical protein
MNQRLHLAAKQVRLAFVAEHGSAERLMKVQRPWVSTRRGPRRQSPAGAAATAAAPYLVLGRGLDAGAVTHEREAAQSERGRQDEVQAEEEPLTQSGAIGQFGGEADLQRRQPVVESFRVGTQGKHFRGAQIAGLDARMRPLGQPPDLLDARRPPSRWRSRRPSAASVEPETAG